MGLNLKSIFKTKKSTYKNLYRLFNDDSIMFSDFGEDIYMSDFINNAIDRIATEISKIQVLSVVERDTVRKQNDDISRLFRFRPNPLQTTSDFLRCCEWLRRKDYNCFIYPQYTEVVGKDGLTYKKYIALYPLNPISAEFGVDESGEIWKVRFKFKDGSEYEILYSDLIHLRWRRGKNNVIGGGNDKGQIDNRDILNTLKTFDKLMQGIPKSLESSLQIKGVYHAKTIVDSNKIKEKRDEFENHIITSKSGIIATDLAGEFTPVNIKSIELDPETLKFLKSILRERYGISEAILSGDYNGEQHSAFYQNCIEDFIVEFEQASSSVLFSQREQDVGHRIKCYYSRVAYMSNTDKMQLATIATNTALMNKDEIRDMFGLSPVGGDLGGKFIQSLNFVDEDIAAKYQVGSKNNGGDKGEE